MSRKGGREEKEGRKDAGKEDGTDITKCGLSEKNWRCVCLSVCVNYTKGQLGQFKHDLNLDLLQFEKWNQSREPDSD